MENLHIVKGTKTPSVEFLTRGELRIEGRSIPENPLEFYKEPLTWLRNFAKSKPSTANMHVNLEYFNTASSKLLFELFKELERLKESGSDANIHWYYEDGNENILEAGEDYKSILKVPFHFVKVI